MEDFSNRLFGCKRLVTLAAQISGMIHNCAGPIYRIAKNIANCQSCVQITDINQ